MFSGCNTVQKRTDLIEQLKRYNKAIVDAEVIERTIKLVQRYAINYKLFAADAIIAANDVISDLELYTFNKKDFEFIQEIDLYSVSR